MSVLSVPPSRPAPSRLASSRRTLPGAARALRLEFKRSAVPWALPLLAAVFYFDALRTADGSPPLWAQRATIIPGNMSWEFGVFAAGLAAWAGSREGRRKTLDLVGTTPRAAWARQSAALAATLGWVLLAFLAGITVIYGQTARQGAWGGPPLWPVLVGVACVTVVTVAGFVAGVLFPGRFTAPLAAIGVFVLFEIGFRQVLGITWPSGTYALLSPDNAPPQVDAGTYYHVAPDVSIVQVMFMGGIAVALFGVLGLAQGLRELGLGSGRAAPRAAFARGDGWLVRAVAAGAIAGGVAAAAVGFSLAGTARPDTVTGGWQISALHTAATDRPVPYAPDCSTSASGFQVCVHPAFGFYLHHVAAELDPVAAEIAGLPGAPVAAREAPSQVNGREVTSGISGNPPVFVYTADHVGAYFGLFLGFDPVGWQAGFQEGLLDAFLEAPAPPGPSSDRDNGPAPLDAVQQAVEDVLLTKAGSPLGASSGHTAPNGKLGAATLPEINAAAQRFGALPASARHAWLATHLAALRAGTVTLAQLP